MGRKNKTILEECETVIDNQMMESLLFYFYEFKEERKEWADSFKQSFCKTVDKLLQEIENNGAEE